MRLTVLGPPALVRDDGTPAGLAPGKTFAVLVYLVHEASAPSRSDLARVFWPDSEPARSRQSVRQTLSLIRKVLGAEAFASDDPVRLRPGAVASDVRDFLEALRAGEIERADAMWRGPFGEGLALADAPEWTRWVEERQLALEGGLCAGLTAAAEAARFRTDEGAEETAEDAIALLQRAIAIDPYRERPRTLLADLLVQRGRFDEAAHEIVEARRALGEDTAELRALEAQVESERRRRYASGEADPAPGLAGIFVGRTSEMGRLLGAWARAEEGISVTAIVEGPAGIGKTRLARELVEHVRRRGGLVAFTSPLPAERAIEGGVIRDLVVQLADGAARLGERSGRGSSARPGRGGKGGGTSAPPGGIAPEALSEDPAEAGDAVAAFLVRLRAPALLVVDDIQWADPYSRAVLARVRRLVTSAPVMALGTVRSEEAPPEVRDTVHAVLRDPGTVGIELGPLSDDEVRELVGLATRIGELETVGALERIVEAARGSPLYVVGLLRTLAETGALVGNGSGQLHLAGPLPDPLPLPAGVRELIERRLEVMPDEAVVVAAHLAAAGGRTGIDRLREATRLETPAFSRALGVLLERDLLRWAAPAELAFAHEEVRRAVARRFPLATDEARQRARRRRRRLGAVAMALASVPILVLAAALLLRPRFGSGPAPSPPRYGGGRLVLVSDREIVEVQPGPGPAETWPRIRTRLPAPAAADYAGPFLTTAGQRALFGRVLEEGAPPRIVRLGPDGAVTDITRSEWDEGKPSLSPDGGLLAWARGRLGGGRYPHEVRIGRSDGGDARTILRHDGKLAVNGWAPSGRYLLVAAAYPGDDSLLVVTPRGERRAGWGGFDGEVTAAWCGQTDRFAVEGTRAGEPGLWLGSPSQAALEPVPAGDVLPYHVACSPDASAVAFARAVEGRLRLVVLDVGSGAFERLPADLDARGGLAWLPDSLAPVPVEVAIAPDSVTLDWGDSVRIAARVLLSDGTAETETLAWQSTDPSVVSVRPDGTVTGSRPGRAVVRAQAQGWIRDSVQVEVRATDRPDVLLREDFATLDSARWIAFGTPPALAVRRGDTTALSLPGDGIAHDGVLSRKPLSLRGGATLEAEFRLPLRGSRPQRVQLCLVDAGPELGSWEEDRFAPDVREEACFTWPADEPDRMRPEEAEVAAAGWRRAVRLPGALPSDDWVRVGVQVRGDGMPFFYLNGRLVAAGPLRLTGLDRPAWHVNLAGTSVGTELLVRRLVVWRGARFVPLAWSLSPIDNSSNTFSVWASSEEDVWVSAGYRVLWHFDGTGWSRPALPPETQNTGTVFGVSPADVWLAGQHGVARFDGTSWTTVLDGVGEMVGIWGTGPSDLYVSGDGRFFHFDGAAWTEIPTGLSTEWNEDRLLAVWGSATDDVWVGGYDGRILHWDGTRLDEAFRERGQNVHAIHGSGPDDVFAVGTNGRIWHWEGAAWRRMESGTDAMLNGVFALSPLEVYVTGERGTLLRWDGVSWEPAGSGTSRNLHGIFALSPERVYIAAQQGALLIGVR